MILTNTQQKALRNEGFLLSKINNPTIRETKDE